MGIAEMVDQILSQKCECNRGQQGLTRLKAAAHAIRFTSRASRFSAVRGSEDCYEESIIGILCCLDHMEEIVPQFASTINHCMIADVKRSWSHESESSAAESWSLSDNYQTSTPSSTHRSGTRHHDGDRDINAIEKKL